MIEEMFRPAGFQYFNKARLNIFAIVCNKVRIQPQRSQVFLIQLKTEGL